MIDRLDNKNTILNELQRAHLHIIDIQQRLNNTIYKDMFRREVSYAIELLLYCS